MKPYSFHAYSRENWLPYTPRPRRAGALAAAMWLAAGVCLLAGSVLTLVGEQRQAQQGCPLPFKPVVVVK